MASRPFELTVNSIITKLFDNIESKYLDSDAHHTKREISENNYKLYLKVEARDWNNFKVSENLLLHLKIDSEADKLIIVENNASIDFMIDLVEAGIKRDQVSIPYLDLYNDSEVINA